MAIYNHGKTVEHRGTEHIRDIYDVGRAMNEIQAEHMRLTFYGKDIAIHRPVDPKGPTKWKLVGREWVPR